MDVDRRLVALLPDDPSVRYNLACSLALTGAREAALDALGEAIQRGYDDPEHLSADDDLASLRDEPRFVALLAGLTRSR